MFVADLPFRGFTKPDSLPSTCGVFLTQVVKIKEIRTPERADTVETMIEVIEVNFSQHN